MSNFLDIARNIANDGDDESYRHDYEKVLELQKTLSLARTKCNFDNHNIETLFCALELAEVTGGIGTIRDDNLYITGSSFHRLIARTINKTQLFHVQRNDHDFIIASGPSGYTNLADLIIALMSEAQPHKVDIVTFNYDVGLEVSLQSRGVGVDYSLGNPLQSTLRNGAVTKLVRMSKLHGSLNWVRSRPLSASESQVEYFDPARALEIGAGVGYGCTLNTGAHLPSAATRDKTASAVPLIVPPTDAKSKFRSEIAPVWRAAHDSLANAEHLVFIGYSLPETDSFFKSLFSLGMVHDTLVRSVSVFDPSIETRQRIRSLMGPLLQDHRVTSKFGDASSIVDGVEKMKRICAENRWML